MAFYEPSTRTIHVCCSEGSIDQRCHVRLNDENIAQAEEILLHSGGYPLGSPGTSSFASYASVLSHLRTHFSLMENSLRVHRCKFILDGAVCNLSILFGMVHLFSMIFRSMEIIVPDNCPISSSVVGVVLKCIAGDTRDGICLRLPSQIDLSKISYKRFNSERFRHSPDSSIRLPTMNASLIGDLIHEHVCLVKSLRTRNLHVYVRSQFLFKITRMDTGSQPFCTIRFGDLTLENMHSVLVGVPWYTTGCYQRINITLKVSRKDFLQWSPIQDTLVRVFFRCFIYSKQHRPWERVVLYFVVDYDEGGVDVDEAEQEMRNVVDTHGTEFVNKMVCAAPSLRSTYIHLELFVRPSFYDAYRQVSTPKPSISKSDAHARNGEMQMRYYLHELLGSQLLGKTTAVDSFQDEDDPQPFLQNMTAKYPIEANIASYFLCK